MAKGFSREYPRGRISGDDEGQAPMAIALDEESNTVILRFAKPMTWIGWGMSEVEQMVMLLAKHLSQMKGQPVSVQVGAETIDQSASKGDPIVDAAELLLHVAGRLQKPLVMAMHPPGNDHNLEPGQWVGSHNSELRPSCQGVVIAVAGDAAAVQAIVDAVMACKKKEEGDHEPLP